MSVVTVQQMADRVAALLAERLRVKGDTLDAKLERAGRRLPRRVRGAGLALAQAAVMIRNPKLVSQVDDETVAVAYDICVRYLTGLNPAARRWAMLIDVVARIAFGLLVVSVLLLVVLLWREPI